MQTLRAKRRGGFTLVEMLAVVVLIGLTLGVGLTLDFADSPQQNEQQARQFANELRIAAQEAVLDGAVWGLDFFTAADNALGYRWLRHEDAAWKPVAVPGLDLADTVFAGAALVEAAGTSLNPETRVAPEALATDARFTPEILLQPTRATTAFTLRIGGADAAQVVVATDALGRVRIDDAPASR